MLLPPFGLTVVTWLDADWPTVFQMTVPAASAAFLMTTTAMARRTADRSPAGLARAAAVSRTWDRVGRIATYIAMLAPLPYAIIRLCWSRGWAVGALEPFVEWLLLTQPENVWIEPILATMAPSGVLLTSGLLCRWGRIFPAWMPGLSGRRVPLWLPLGLGGSAGMAVWSFGRGMLLGRLGVELPGQVSGIQAWGMPVSGWAYWGVDGLAWVLFPLWGISLGVALVGYYHRRRLLDHQRRDSTPDMNRSPERHSYDEQRRPSCLARPMFAESGSASLVSLIRCGTKEVTITMADPFAKRPRMSRRWRLTLVVVHILSAAAWIGVDVIVAVLVGVGQLSSDVETQSLAYRALATFVVWPMLTSALVCLTSGIVLGLGTKWGLVRYWWVAVKLVLNLALCTLIWFALRPGMPAVGAYGEELLGGAPDPAAVSSLFMPPAVSLSALTIAVLLSIFKPWGRITKRTANTSRTAESPVGMAHTPGRS